MMNSEQLTGLIRTLLAAGGPIAGLMALYGLPPDKVTAWVSLAAIVLPPIAAGIWSFVAKRTDAQLARVEAMPGVKIAVDTSAISQAPQAAKEAAADPSRPNVERMKS